MHMRSCRLRRYWNTMIRLPVWLPLNPNSNSISPLGTLTALWETLKNEANFSWTSCSVWKISSSFAPPANVFVLNWVWICRGMRFWRWLGVCRLKLFFGCVGTEILCNIVYLIFIENGKCIRTPYAEILSFKQQYALSHDLQTFFY